MHLTLQEPNQCPFNIKILTASSTPDPPNQNQWWPVPVPSKTWHSSSLAEHTAEIAK
jgi:hypothetical protein